MQQGIFALSRGDAAQAESHYKKAVNGTLTLQESGMTMQSCCPASIARRKRLSSFRPRAGSNLAMPSSNISWHSHGTSWANPAKHSRACRPLSDWIPAIARAWYNLGLVFSSAGRSEEALDALTRAESVDGSDPRSPYARATILARQGRVEEARRAAQRALEIEPGFESARELLRTLP